MHICTFSYSIVTHLLHSTYFVCHIPEEPFRRRLPDSIPNTDESRDSNTTTETVNQTVETETVSNETRTKSDTKSSSSNSTDSSQKDTNSSVSDGDASVAKETGSNDTAGATGVEGAGDKKSQSGDQKTTESRIGQFYIILFVKCFNN